MNYLLFTISAYLSYHFNKSLSKKDFRLNKKLPNIRIKFFQFSPNIKIHLKHRTLHIHHWLTYSVILIITFTANMGILDALFSKGFLVGGIIQGLTFPDWNKLIIQTKHNN